MTVVRVLAPCLHFLHVNLWRLMAVRTVRPVSTVRAVCFLAMPSNLMVVIILLVAMLFLGKPRLVVVRCRSVCFPCVVGVSAVRSCTMLFSVMARSVTFLLVLFHSVGCFAMVMLCMLLF